MAASRDYGSTLKIRDILIQEINKVTRTDGYPLSDYVDTESMSIIVEWLMREGHISDKMYDDMFNNEFLSSIK